MSPTTAAAGREKNIALNREHQRKCAESLAHGDYEIVQSAHLIQAEQPAIVVALVRSLLGQEEAA
jgi:hypothetical protein